MSRLKLPDDWRERLAELAEHREERENLEGRRNYLRGKLRRLRELYLEGDFEKAEYNRQLLLLIIEARKARQRPVPASR